MPGEPRSAQLPGGLLDCIQRHWGFRSLRPLQEQAMQAILNQRDSLVVLPTGGGKSLCFQAPAVYRQKTTLVVSPLIALMKDQVDGLLRCGIPAVSIDSSLSDRDRFVAELAARQGEVRLIFASPERLLNTDFYRVLQQAGVDTFAIDEAHCISHWGHDFRPEYRQLAKLREVFPTASVHAFTATATESVREDIIRQLALRDPLVLVGSFDRPNLTFRVLPRQGEFGPSKMLVEEMRQSPSFQKVLRQVLEVLARHVNEAGIIYCLRKRDVDVLASELQARGYKALPYHAGLSDLERVRCSEAFASEQADIVVATIAFGMGIDRSNVRFVLHTAMPKSIEHYQQEAGRAGRDGLEAECVLLFSYSDVVTYKFIVEKSAEEAKQNGGDDSFVPGALRHLDDMNRYCRGARCRHAALVQYFGQTYDRENCGACDLCLGDTEQVPDATVVAQKILSCVARVKESFGINHIISVLRGEDTETVRRKGHEALTTFGLLKGIPKTDIREWIYQLIGQGMLVQTGDEYPVLRLNEASWEILRGKRTARLVQVVRRKKGERVRESAATTVSWEGVDRELFDALRELRRQFASKQQVPPYVIFNDSVLRDLARHRPANPEEMLQIAGVGATKLRDYGPAFLKLLKEFSGNRPADSGQDGRVQRSQAGSLFRSRRSIEQVMEQLGLERSAVVDLLVDWIRQEKPSSIHLWVPIAICQQVAEATRQLGTARLQPVELILGKKVPREQIRLVLAFLETRPT